MIGKHDRWFQYTGAIHIHTTESDGTRPLAEIIDSGRRVGLEFMMFCDHMTLAHRERGAERFYGNTLVTIGYEHNDRDDRNHYLLFDSPGVYDPRLSAAEYVAAAAADGALGIIAHPDEIRNRLREHPAFPWTEWGTDAFDGIEVWNQMSEWMERLTRLNTLFMALSPRKSIVAPVVRTLQRWDQINRGRPCAGIAGLDAHAFKIRTGPFTFDVFPYKVHFRSLRCYVLLDEPMSADWRIAKSQLYRAIRECRLFFANVRWGEADDFDLTVESAGRLDTCGGRVPLSEEAVLRCRLPERATIRLIRDGELELRTKSRQLEYRIARPGVYRVEVFKGRRGWIFSNHVRVVA